MSASTSSRFPLEESLPEAPHHIAYFLEMSADPAPDKIGLLYGAYRDGEGRPWVLPSVAEMEEVLAEELLAGREDHNYPLFEGVPRFGMEACKLALGANSLAIKEGRAMGFQMCNGSGAQRVALEALQKCLPETTCVYVSNPTWLTYDIIIQKVGFELREYRYWDPKTKSLDLQGLLQDLEDAPPGSIIILQPCGHNPTGLDPSQAQWREIAKVMKEKELFPLFDMAYQGFATGDQDTDAWPVRLFESQGFEMFVTQSFSKNFGLYGERIGCLSFVLNDSAGLLDLRNMIFSTVRALYNAPCGFPAKIVRGILEDEVRTEAWKKDIKTMAERVVNMRRQLRSRLEALNGQPGSWAHVTQQTGMFCFTGLSRQQCEYLKREKHIYIYQNGRLNISALAEKNLERLALAMHEAAEKN